jgi:hypothetical protein
MRYLMLIKHTEDYRNKTVPASLYEAMGEFVGAAMTRGTILDTAGLQPTSAGARIGLRGGSIAVTDGPFVESKEIIGGYALVEAASRDEAVALGREFMELHRIHWPAFEGECEIRPLESGVPEPPR